MITALFTAVVFVLATLIGWTVSRLLDRGNPDAGVLSVGEKWFLASVEGVLWAVPCPFLGIADQPQWIGLLLGAQLAERFILGGVISGFVATILWMPIALLRSRQNQGGRE